MEGAAFIAAGIAKCEPRALNTARFRLTTTPRPYSSTAGTHISHPDRRNSIFYAMRRRSSRCESSAALQKIRCNSIHTAWQFGNRKGLRILSSNIVRRVYGSRGRLFAWRPPSPASPTPLTHPPPSASQATFCSGSSRRNRRDSWGVGGTGGAAQDSGEN